jgi:GDP-4-dehydro-6-deoxy-D-mannose reductase
MPVRSFNHTGPGQAPDFVAPSLARQIALIERGVVEPVIRVGNLEAIRDFTDVRDVIRAYVALMQRGQAGAVYNVGSGVGRSIRSVLDALLARARVEVRVETDPARLRPSDVPALVADAARLRLTTGWQPVISFERMLDDLMEYWREKVRSERFEAGT